MRLIRCETCATPRPLSLFTASSGGDLERLSCNSCQRRQSILLRAEEIDAPLEPADAGTCWSCGDPICGWRDRRTRICETCRERRHRAKTDLSKARAQQCVAERRVASVRRCHEDHGQDHLALSKLVHARAAVLITGEALDGTIDFPVRRSKALELGAKEALASARLAVQILSDLAGIKAQSRDAPADAGPRDCARQAAGT